MKTCKKQMLIMLISLSILIILSSCGAKKLEVNMFADLSECYAIELLETSDVQITLYDSPIEDEYIGNLEYANYYACHYLSSEVQFDLFAYEFYDQETAKQYFKNVTGKEDDRTVTYSDLEGFSSYRRIVISDNSVYSVYTAASDAEAVIEIINQIFSRKIVAVEW